VEPVLFTSLITQPSGTFNFMPSVVLWNNVVVPFRVACTGDGWLVSGCCCCCCAFVIVILGAKRIIAIANTAAEITVLLITGKTNDCEDALMMLGTNTIQVLQQNKGNVLKFSIKSP
jgi:hypothetical protein